MPSRLNGREFEESVFDHICEQREEREEDYDTYDYDDTSTEYESRYDREWEYYKTLFQKEAPRFVLESHPDRVIAQRTFKKDGVNETTVTIYKDRIVYCENNLVTNIKQKLSPHSYIHLKKELGCHTTTFYYNVQELVNFELIAFHENSHEFIFAFRDEHGKLYNMKICLSEDGEFCFLRKMYKTEGEEPFTFDLSRVVETFKKYPYFRFEDIHKDDMTVQNHYISFIDIEIGRYILAYLFETLNLCLKSVYFPEFNTNTPILERLIEGSEVEKYRSFFRTIYRVGELKEELMAAAWHPSRVAAWLEAGLEIEDL